MFVLKEGDAGKVEYAHYLRANPIRFACPLCGTEFVAYRNEYKSYWKMFDATSTADDGPTRGYSAKCPRCKVSPVLSDECHSISFELYKEIEEKRMLYPFAT